MDSTKPKSRRDLFLWIKEYLSQFKKPIQLSLKRTRELFEEDYAYNEKELYIGYEFTAGYILICSETVYDERIYNFVLTELDWFPSIEYRLDIELRFHQYVLKEHK